MKKRIAALIISVLMLVSLLLVTVFAGRDVKYFDLSICDTQVTSDNCGDVLGDGKVSYNPYTKTLRLADGAALTAPKGKSCIDADGINLTVVAAGACALTATGDCSAIDVCGSSLTMTGGSWTVSADKGHAIYAEGSFDETEGGYTYLSGGDVTITDCTDVLLSVDQGGDGENVYYDTLYAHGAIELKDCPSFKIVSYDEGISVGYGGMIVDNCGLSIEIKGKGIGIYDAWSYDYDCKTGMTPDVIIRNCPKLNVQAKESHAIYVGGVWGEDEQHRGADYDTFYAGTGNLRISNCNDVAINNDDSTDCAAIYVCGGVSFTDCASVRLISGCKGIYVGSDEMLIDGCDFSVEGIGENFIYGIECDDSDVTEGCDFNPSIVIRDCPRVEFNVPNGAAMYSGGIWVSGGEDERGEYVSGGTITVSDCGSFTVNGTRGICSMGHMIFTDCPDVEINVDDFGLFNCFGTMEINNCDAKLTSERSCICAGAEKAGLIVKNGGKLIAYTQSKDQSAVYAKGGINVDNGTLFASSAGIAAVSCPQPGKIIFGKNMTVGGSTKQLGYTERDMADSAVTESYNAEFEEYALFIGDDPALTVYATVH